MGLYQHVTRGDDANDLRIAERRSTLTSLYDSLPPSTSPGFWLAVDTIEIPLEVLVRLLRAAIVREDQPLRGRLIALIAQRTQTMNERWAAHMLRELHLHVDEYQMLVLDLCADLRECLIRALLDLQRPFWEENFLHCLYFERKHVYRTFMYREGWWGVAGHTGRRVPRAVVASLDRLIYYVNERTSSFDIEDERAYQILHALEYSDLMGHVFALPERLRTVILLIYWEGRTAKDIAHILSIAERTVRYRLHAALQTLREALL